MRYVVLILMLVLSNCKALKGVKAMAAGGSIQRSQKMVTILSSTFSMLQYHKHQGAAIKVIKINVQQILDQSCKDEIKRVSL